jgi:penicillin-binding protein 1A
MSPEESWLMVSMMKDVVRKGTAAGSVGSQFSYPAGGKTGTTNDGADVWFIGYTSDLVAGVWMGLDKPQKIKNNAQGGILAAPAWTSFMREVYRRKPAPPDWPRPDGIVIRDIDPVSGMLAGPGCGGTVSEFFIAGTDPTQTCVPTGYGTPGYPGDTTGLYPPVTGYPPGSAPPPRQPPPVPVDTFRPRMSDTTVFSRPRTATPGAMVVPGATPIPRASRPQRDTMRLTPRDSIRPQRDSSNPFRIPPAK